MGRGGGGGGINQQAIICRKIYILLYCLKKTELVINTHMHPTPLMNKNK